MKKIAIHSVPRSGSSWIGQIFNSSPLVNYKYQPLFSYAFKNYLDDSSSLEKINLFFKEIADSNDDFLNQRELVKRGSYPDLVKSDKFSFVVYKEVRYHYIIENLLEKDPEIMVIGLVRNPLATIHSWWKAPREFRLDLQWDILEEWQWARKKNQDKKEEYNGYEKWKEVVLLFEKLKKRYPQRFCLLEYQDIVRQPHQAIEQLFDFCGLPFEKPTQDFIIDSTSTGKKEDDAYSVYRQLDIKDDKWRNSLPIEIIDVIQTELRGTPLSKYLYG